MIHPEIKKFWENTGYEISSGSIWDEKFGNMTSWHRHIPPVFKNHKIIARYFVIDGQLEMRYFLDPLDGNRYTEKEMLKLIKLKAFL